MKSFEEEHKKWKKKELVAREFHTVAYIAGIREINRLVRLIFANNPTIDRFVMGMGTTAFFEKNANEPLSWECGPPQEFWNELRTFLDKYNEEYKFTGYPLKMWANGREATDW